MLGTEGRVLIGRRPGTVDAEPSAARCDVRDAVDRLKTFVVVRVPVEIQDVLEYRSPNPFRIDARPGSPAWNPVEYAGRWPYVTM